MKNQHKLILIHATLGFLVLLIVSSVPIAFHFDKISPVMDVMPVIVFLLVMPIAGGLISVMGKFSSNPPPTTYDKNVCGVVYDDHPDY